ncbi:MAG: phasin family protein [Herminiimonas sp.]|nr:phasin family protein [Herminiimonas sp.]
MFPIQDQISIVTRTSLENQLAAFAALTNKTFEGMEKLFDLNINVVRASLEESSVIMNQLMSAKDPQEFFSLVAAQARPTAEKALSYSRHLTNIASGTQAEFSKAAEAQFEETSRKVTRLVEDAAKNAPAGSENVVALVKSAIDNASAGYEQLSKTTKQAAEAIEANLNAAVTQLAQATEKTPAAG